MANRALYDLIDVWDNPNTTFDAIKLAVTNTGSTSGSDLLDLSIVGGASIRVTKAGDIIINGVLRLQRSGNVLLLRNLADNADLHLRVGNLQFSGGTFLAGSLPTSDPEVAGQIYTMGGALFRSDG